MADQSTLKIPTPMGICKRCALDSRQTKTLPDLPTMLLSHCPHHNTGGHILLTAAKPMWTLLTPVNSQEWADWVADSLGMANALTKALTEEKSNANRPH